MEHKSHQDKAIEIMQRMGGATLFSDDNDGRTLSLPIAKKLSFIMVNEIIRALDESGTKSLYWEAVRADIQNF